MKKCLLILDLDETLIYATEKPLERAADFGVGPYQVYRRPFLEAFLTGMAKSFELAVWSTGTDDYVADICRQIQLKDSPFQLIWGRSPCNLAWSETDGEFIHIKRLAKLKRKGYQLERMLIVDDTPAKCRENYGNAVYVKPFMGDLNDNELQRLATYLPRLADCPKVRRIEKSDWRRELSP